MKSFIKKYYLLLMLLTINFYDASAQVWSGTTSTGYSWRSGNVGIGSNDNTAQAKLFIFNITNPNAHLTIGGNSPGIKFNLSTFSGDLDNSTIGLVSNSGQYMGNSLPYDFIFRNNNNGSNILFGTTNASGLSERMRIASTGRVGIGSSNPSAYFHVSYSNGSSIPLALFESGQNTTNLTARLTIVNHSSNGAPKNYIDGYSFVPSNSAYTPAPIYFQSTSGGTVGFGNFPSGSGTQYFTPGSLLHVQNGNIQITNSSAPALLTDVSKYGLTMGFNGNTTKATTDYSWLQSSNGPLLLNPLSGNTLAGAQTNNYVAIGFTPSAAELAALPPVGYNLLVQGKVMCEELKIKLKKDGSGNTVWYDHVFLPTYKLMPLDSLENYIAQNSHLPEVPTEADVQKNGIMAGEMSGLLLKKVEELTLYVIEQNKNTETQAAQIELLKKQNELLMQQVQLLITNKTK